MCLEPKPLSDYYSQTRKNGQVYYHPECKKCTVKKSLKWRLENREKWLASETKGNRKQKYIDIMKEAGKKYRESGKQLTWSRNNKDKIKKYQEDRRHMIHDISDLEWAKCKEYFDNSCAYCGISETEHYKLFCEQLQKDHVRPDGSNKIDNCIPACKSCNPSKKRKDMENWYRNKSGKFNSEKLDRIYYWLENYIEIIKE